MSTKKIDAPPKRGAAHNYFLIIILFLFFSRESQLLYSLSNDSFSIDYTGKKAVEGLGILETSFGLHIHPTIAFMPGKICLGCIDLKMWTRDPNAKGKSLSSHVRNNEAKKGYCNLQYLAK